MGLHIRPLCVVCKSKTHAGLCSCWVTLNWPPVFGWRLMASICFSVVDFVQCLLELAAAWSRFQLQSEKGSVEKKKDSSIYILSTIGSFVSSAIITFCTATSYPVAMDKRYIDQGIFQKLPYHHQHNDRSIVPDLYLSHRNELLILMLKSERADRTVFITETFKVRLSSPFIQPFFW